MKQFSKRKKVVIGVTGFTIVLCVAGIIGFITTPKAALCHIDRTVEVLVDYDRPLPVAIKAGKYDGMEDNFTQESFPADPARKGKVKVTFDLIACDQGDFSDKAILSGEPLLSSDKAISESERLSGRSGEIRELLSLGEAMPELQREFPIVAFDSPSRSGNVPVLGGRDIERHLRLSWLANSRGLIYRYLAVRT